MNLLYNKNLCYQFYLVMISEDLSFISTNQETSKGRLYKENYSQTRSEFQSEIVIEFFIPLPLDGLSTRHRYLFQMKEITTGQD